MGQKVEICSKLKMMELLVEREFNIKIKNCDKTATTAFCIYKKDKHLFLG